MKTGFVLLVVAVLAACEARLAEKVSEDDDFVVYRIPVRALDLQSQATGLFEGYELTPSHGRSSSKSSSHSKSSSSSTGTGKGKGYGQGGSSQGHGEGYGGSSSGHGYGGSSGGHGYGGGSGGHGYGGGSGGSGGSGGHGYGGGSGGQGYGGGSGGSGSGYGGSGSGGQGYSSGGSGTGYGGSGSGGSGTGYGGGGSGTGYGGNYRGGLSNYGSGGHSNYGSGGHSNYAPGGHANYGPSYDSAGHAPHYDDDEGGDQPKVITTTKTVTTNSAQDTGLNKLSGHNYRQPSDSLGDIRFKLGDYLKDAPGHETSKYSQKFFEGAQAELAPGYRSGQGFNVNEFTRTLNHGMGSAFNNPSYRNNRFVPQASIVIPRAYAFRHAGFGLPGF